MLKWFIYRQEFVTPVCFIPIIFRFIRYFLHVHVWENRRVCLLHSRPTCLLWDYCNIYIFSENTLHVAECKMHLSGMLQIAYSLKCLLSHITNSCCIVSGRNGVIRNISIVAGSVVALLCVVALFTCGVKRLKGEYFDVKKMQLLLSLSPRLRFFLLPTGLIQ